MSLWTQRYNKYLTNLVFSVRTVSYGSSFFPLGFMSRVLRTWAVNQSGKNLVCNLQNGPRTRLVRGIYKIITATLGYFTFLHLLNMIWARWLQVAAISALCALKQSSNTHGQSSANYCCLQITTGLLHIVPCIIAVLLSSNILLKKNRGFIILLFSARTHLNWFSKAGKMY